MQASITRSPLTTCANPLCYIVQRQRQLEIERHEIERQRQLAIEQAVCFCNTCMLFVVVFGEESSVRKWYFVLELYICLDLLLSWFVVGQAHCHGQDGQVEQFKQGREISRNQRRTPRAGGA